MVLRLVRNQLSSSMQESVGKGFFIFNFLFKPIASAEIDGSKELLLFPLASSFLFFSFLPSYFLLPSNSAACDLSRHPRRMEAISHAVVLFQEFSSIVQRLGKSRHARPIYPAQHRLCLHYISIHAYVWCSNNQHRFHNLGLFSFFRKSFASQRLNNHVTCRWLDSLGQTHRPDAIQVIWTTTRLACLLPTDPSLIFKRRLRFLRQPAPSVYPPA